MYTLLGNALQDQLVERKEPWLWNQRIWVSYLTFDADCSSNLGENTFSYLSLSFLISKMTGGSLPDLPIPS